MKLQYTYFTMLFLLFTFFDANAVSIECEKDTDCKILYDNCNCIAVMKNDPRKIWDSGSSTVCKCNSCRCNESQPQTFIKAKCKKNKCIRDSKN